MRARALTIVALVFTALAGCTVVPLDGNNPASHALPPPEGTRIEQRLEREGFTLAHAEDSAVRLLSTGHEAWEDRLRLVQLADESLAHPSAGSLVALAHARALREEFVRPDEIEPLYLRRPDAEVNWQTRPER